MNPARLASFLSFDRLDARDPADVGPVMVQALFLHLEAAGVLDPNVRIRPVLEAWAGAIPGPVTMAELVELAKAHPAPDLRNALAALLGPNWTEPKALGERLGKVAGQDVAGFRLVRTTRAAAGWLWVLETTGPRPGVTFAGVTQRP